jgi:hypothetical protein
VSNGTEFADGTIPNDINSADYTLQINSNQGTVAVSDAPNARGKYPRGKVLALTPSPNPGLIFNGWTGDVVSIANPLPFTVIGTKEIITLHAQFGTSLPVALDTNLVFTTGGDVPWTGQVITSMDGVDAAQSGGPIGHNKQSWMETTVNGPGEISFAWKVSSRAGDYLEFHIDGVLKTGRISGNVDWVMKSYAVEPGTHTLRWRYVKDGSDNNSNVSDAGWVDGLTWTPAATGYHAWLANYFTVQELGNPAIVGQNADPDRDGVANLIEYAFGGDPSLPGNPSLFKVSPEVVKIGGKDRLRLRFGLPAVTPADLLYQIEVSDDLGGWIVVAERSGAAVWEGSATSLITPAGARSEHLVTDGGTAAPSGKRMGRITVTLQ